VLKNKQRVKLHTTIFVAITYYITYKQLQDQICVKFFLIT